MSDAVQCDVCVIGSGPGGYAAAFRAADLGFNVALVERYPSIGGVCLNVGCIPSKAYLHAAKIIDEAHEMSDRGIQFGAPKIDKNGLRDYKNSVVKKLTTGLAGMAKQRKVKIVNGFAKFAGPNELSIEDADGKSAGTVSFKYCIIAAGSVPVHLPFIPHDDERVFDSTGALELNRIDGNMLVLGGGIIGCEMATVYRALGAKVTIVELMDQLMPGADKDLVQPCAKRMQSLGTEVWLKTKVTAVDAKKDGLYVSFEGDKAPDKPVKFDQMLVSVGRTPNGKWLNADKAGVTVDERGFVKVDKQLKTSAAHIFAIGDIIGQPMLAHKATTEGRLAAEIIADIRDNGQSKKAFDPRSIASVAYTDPEVAWAGLTETECKAQGIAYEKGVFPWMASGRALGTGRSEGFTKLLFDPDTHRLIGAGIVGSHAGDLIAEAALALETDCDAEDIASTIHPHPTLSETVALAAEVFEGTVTDLYVPKKKS